MDRHSSYIFVWLQLELCAMAVLLTRGEGGRDGASGRARSCPRVPLTPPGGSREGSGRL